MLCQQLKTSERLIPMVARSVNNLAIVAIAYALMIGVDFLESPPIYYLCCMLVHLIIMCLCLKGKGAIIKVYGLANFFPLALYYPYVFYGNEITKSLMWGGVVNFANFILAIELLIVLNGVKHGLLSIFNCWFDNVVSQWGNSVLFDKGLDE